MKIGSYFNDERTKLKHAPMCWYCGSGEQLSIDHIIPRRRGGADGGENLIHACKSCNSSKGSKDLLVWCEAAQRFPPLALYIRYLKLAIRFCTENEILDVAISEVDSLELCLPFDPSRIVLEFPPASQICLLAGGERNQLRADA